MAERYPKRKLSTEEISRALNFESDSDDSNDRLCCTQALPFWACPLWASPFRLLPFRLLPSGLLPLGFSLLGFSLLGSTLCKSEISRGTNAKILPSLYL